MGYLPTAWNYQYPARASHATVQPVTIIGGWRAWSPPSNSPENTLLAQSRVVTPFRLETYRHVRAARFPTTPRTAAAVTFNLLYYWTDLHGNPVACPGFVSVENDSLAVNPRTRQFVRIDIDRTWQLTRALLTNNEIDLLWVFVSQDVEAMLVQHAQALGEPNWLVWRALQVLHQPRDSAPHDDHMHVRVACTAQERPAGCEGGGPFWPWFPADSTGYNLDASWLDAIAHDEPLTTEAEWLSTNVQTPTLP